MSLSRSDRKALKHVFSAVTDPTLGKYLDEAKRCVEADACRAAVVLAWCGVVHHLHRQVEHMGFDFFMRCHRTKFPSEKPPQIQALADLREVKDFKLLAILVMMGIVQSEEDHNVLDGFRELRNQCAHVGPSAVTQHEVLEWFTKIERFVVSEAGAEQGYRHPAHAVSLIEDEDYELPPARIRGIIERVRQEDHLAFVDKLINLYFSAGSTHRQRDRVEQVWDRLALDEHVKIEANRKIALKLDKVDSLNELRARHLVFWPHLKQAGSTYATMIVSNLLSEFHSIVEGREVVETDLSILKTMIENSIGENRQECEQLYAIARELVYGKDNEEALKAFAAQASSITN